MHTTAFHLGWVKYLTPQDTHITPTLTKHKKTLARLVKLISLQQRSITQIIGPVLSLVLSKLIKKLGKAMIL